MAHAVLINDVHGDVVEAVFYCSDHHAKTHAGYAGWYGSVELDFGQGCSLEGCTEVLHGIETCYCKNPDCRGFQKSE